MAFAVYLQMGICKYLNYFLFGLNICRFESRNSIRDKKNITSNSDNNNNLRKQLEKIAITKGHVTRSNFSCNLQRNDDE